MAERRAIIVSTVLGLGLALALVQPAQGQNKDPCDRCKPKRAEWSWKANGYAVAASADEAETSAKKRATDSACESSDKYLAPQRLSCRYGCTDGEITNTCTASTKSGCSNGIYADDKSMWIFVCRKFYEKADKRVSCDKDEAANNPGWSMCDVSVTAVKERACSHPDCIEPPEPDDDE